MKSQFLEKGMKLALQEAQKSFEQDEVPVGAIVLYENKIISKAHNLVETLQDSTAHAEMLAITAAMEKLRAKTLEDCTLFVTLEPCLMCAGALYWSRIGTLVFAATDEKRGFSKCNCNIIHPKTKIITGIFEEQSKILLKKFFQRKRL